MNLAPPASYSPASHKKRFSLTSHRKSASQSSLAISVGGSPSNYDIPPELVPVVTLLSAQGHRRYVESNFMLLRDLNNEGAPADRVWHEVYGVLTGFQLAMWDAKTLSQSRGIQEKFNTATKKIEYLNLADASIKPLMSMPSSGKNLTNVILISTTAKNRFILQFQSKELLFKWHAALRLAIYEYVSLQEAYTGALLSAKGSKLSDIKVILAESKYNYEHWVLMRFGVGGPYRKYWVVIEPHTKKKKNSKGRILIYEHEKVKRAPLVAELVSAAGVYAVYPTAPQMIDTTTLIKIDCKMIKSKKEAAEDISVFVMPEAHSSVPGYDTLIRFLIPALDAFQLYGRPKKLNADKQDPDSLLFGLPVLPHVHYLQLEDVESFADPVSACIWPINEWTAQLKDLLKRKMQTGYTGCGSAHGVDGALNSPAFNGNSNPGSPTGANFLPTPNKDRFSSNLGNSVESVTLVDNNKNISNLSLESKPIQPIRTQETVNSYMNDNSNPYLSDSNNPYNNNSSNRINEPKPLPLPSDSNQSFYDANSNNASLLPLDNNNFGPKSNGKMLPLPSDGYSSNGLNINNASASPLNGSFSNPYSSSRNSPTKNLPLPSDNHNNLRIPNESLDFPQVATNKRISEISQIYTDYAKIPSPKDQDLSMALSKLHFKEVDDAEFDLSNILTETKLKEKRHSKRDVDLFDPGYSESILSPSVDILNPFGSNNTSNRNSKNTQPTLPQISIDDDLSTLDSNGLRINGPQGPRAFPGSNVPSPYPNH